MNSPLRNILRECANHLFEIQDVVHPDQIVECARRGYPQVFTIETERLVMDAARRLAKQLLRDQANDDEDETQPRLPGISLPSAIAIPENDEYVYVRSDKATLSQLEAGETIRLHNVEAAVAALDRYRASVIRLKPHFDAQHLTVADAYQAWRESQDGAA